MAQKMTSKNQPKDYKSQLIFLVNQDIKAKRNEYFFPSPDFLTNLLIKDPRDKPLWYCLWNVIAVTLLQLCSLPYLMNSPWYYIAIPTVIRFILLCAPRFVLALHFASHRPIISPNWLNTLVLEIITPLMGIPCGAYRSHHIIMHHKENNIYPQDLSSTMPYQRDNFFHFLHYWFRFEFCVWLELPLAMIRKGFYALGIRTAGCLFLYAYVVRFVWGIRPAFSLWLFIIPQAIVSFLLMFGNWSQHIFIDPKSPEDNHRLTYNLINTPYNQVTFNDGYHIIHHKYPALHWSEIPNKFLEQNELEIHAKEDALTFYQIDYFWMGVLVMVGNLKKLATHVVPISQQQAAYSIDDIVKIFKERLTPILT